MRIVPAALALLGAAALAALDGFPPCEFRQALADVVEFCISRAR